MEGVSIGLRPIRKGGKERGVQPMKKESKGTGGVCGLRHQQQPEGCLEPNWLRIEEVGIAGAACLVWSSFFDDFVCVAPPEDAASTDMP